MKTYMGIPGEPAVISVTDGRNGRTWTLEGQFGWGKGNVHCRDTALAVLKDYLQDDTKAMRFHTRFIWRVVAGWRPTLPWTLTGADIAMTISAIEETERSTAVDRLRVLQERGPVEHEAGIGPGGGAFSPIIIKN